MLIVFMLIFSTINYSFCHGWSFWDYLSGYGNEVIEEVETITVTRRFQLIFPGTKWCGAGNIAANFTDLGSHNDTDSCCRQHDYCKDVIFGGETKYGLTNPTFYTRLHCHCDHLFYKCLKGTNEMVSDNLGMIYFNVLGTQCYDYEHPIITCSLYKGFRCLEYDFNDTEDEIWQWFDLPVY